VVTAQKRVSALQDRVADLQRAFENNTVDPKLRSEIESELPHTKRELGRAAADLQRLQTEELDATSQAANEQARWAEINQLLESLERTLTR
jgi:peptidoglycan hydrolase CwlO-like protein